MLLPRLLIPFGNRVISCGWRQAGHLSRPPALSRTETRSLAHAPAAATLLMLLPSFARSALQRAAWSIFNCALGRGPSEGARWASKKTTRLSVCILPSSLFFLPHKGGWSHRDLRWVQGPIAAVGVLTHPTLGAPGRALFPRGDGETHCSKVRHNHPFKLCLYVLSRRVRLLPTAPNVFHRPPLRARRTLFPREHRPIK